MECNSNVWMLDIMVVGFIAAGAIPFCLIGFLCFYDVALYCCRKQEKVVPFSGYNGIQAPNELDFQPIPHEHYSPTLQPILQTKREPIVLLDLKESVKITQPPKWYKVGILKFDRLIVKKARA